MGGYVLKEPIRKIFCIVLIFSTVLSYNFVPPLAREAFRSCWSSSAAHKEREAFRSRWIEAPFLLEKGIQDTAYPGTLLLRETKL